MTRRTVDGQRKAVSSTLLVVLIFVLAAAVLAIILLGGLGNLGKIAADLPVAAVNSIVSGFGAPFGLNPC